MQNHLYLYPNMVAVRKKKCTQYELAEEFGITQQEISRYERGEVKAPINYIVDLAQFCGVSVEYILGLSRGTTDMLSDDDFELLEIYDKLNDENRIKLRERAETLLEIQRSEK